MTEAFDVPPPPKARTLRLSGLHGHPVELGVGLALRSHEIEVMGDVVDHTESPPEIIVYVPESVAQTLIDRGVVRVP